jgi:putative acyl-CoA dehydrogenase
MTATHEVFNQPEPLVNVNLFDGNRALRSARAFNAPALDTAPLQTLGERVGSAAMQTHAWLANVFTPQLKSYDRFGQRIDRVEFHPSHHALMTEATAAGLHGTLFAQAEQTAGHPHLKRAEGFMLFIELEPSILCPISMTYAVTPVLQDNAAIYCDWAPQLTSRAHDPALTLWKDKPGVTMVMGMTEKQGGSDVRANTTQAVLDGEDGWGQRFRVTGHKWFFSAPMCDAFLILAQTPSGLSCLFLPRVLPDGSLNQLFIQRLKDKLGNQANASSEVEFVGASAWLVGEEGRGVPQILAMGTMIRLDCAQGTAGLMRHALSLSLNHTTQRQAFGKALIDQPLMQNVLADLALESEAALAHELAPARGMHQRAGPPGQHPADPRGGNVHRDRSAPPRARRGTGGAGRAAGPNRTGRRVRRILRVATGRALGPQLRLAGCRHRFRHHHRASDAHMIRRTPVRPPPVEASRLRWGKSFDRRRANGDFETP